MAEVDVASVASGLGSEHAELPRNVEREPLIQQLDELLERYLHTLDEYEKVSKELSEQLSSGYMSLAQANFHNSSSAIRYGKDCYDERMQAIRKVRVFEDGVNGSTSDRPHFAIKSAAEEVKRERPDQASEKSQSETATDEQASDETPSKETPDADANANSSQESNDTKETPSESARLIDPLRWFGILVPPALRTAQSTFIVAVEGPVVQLATVAKDLRGQEIEIGRVRKQIKKL